MATIFTLGKMTDTAADLNIDLRRLNSALIKGAKTTTPSAGITNTNWNYASSADARVPLGIFQNSTVRRNSIASALGLSGQLISTDDNGVRSIVGPFSGQLIVTLPSGLAVASTHYRQIVESVFGLHVSGVTSGIVDIETFDRLIGGELLW